MRRLLLLVSLLALMVGPAFGQSKFPADRIEFDDTEDLQQKFDAGDLGGTVDAIGDINPALRTGLDAQLVTGTPGTAGNCVEYNADGDLVEAVSGLPCGAGAGANPMDDAYNVTCSVGVATIPAASGVFRVSSCAEGDEININDVGADSATSQIRLVVINDSGFEMVLDASDNSTVLFNQPAGLNNTVVPNGAQFTAEQTGASSVSIAGTGYPTIAERSATQTASGQTSNNLYGGITYLPSPLYMGVGVQLASSQWDCGPVTTGFGTGSRDQWDEPNPKLGFGFNLAGPGTAQRLNKWEHSFWRRFETNWCSGDPVAGTGSTKGSTYVEHNMELNAADVILTLSNFSDETQTEQDIQTALASNDRADQIIQFSGGKYALIKAYSAGGAGAGTLTVRMGIGGNNPADSDSATFKGETFDTGGSTATQLVSSFRPWHREWDTWNDHYSLSLSTLPGSLGAPTALRLGNSGMGVNWSGNLSNGFSAASVGETGVPAGTFVWTSAGLDGQKIQQTVVMGPPYTLDGAASDEATFEANIQVGDRVAFSGGGYGRVIAYNTGNNRLSYQSYRPWTAATPVATDTVRVEEVGATVASVIAFSHVTSAGRFYVDYSGSNFAYSTPHVMQMLSPQGVSGFAGRGNSVNWGRGFEIQNQLYPATNLHSNVITIHPQGCDSLTTCSNGNHGLLHWGGGDWNSGHEMWGSDMFTSANNDRWYRDQAEEKWRSVTDANPTGTNGDAVVLALPANDDFPVGSVLIGSLDSQSNANSFVKPTAVATDGQILIGATGTDPAFQTLSGHATLDENGVLTVVDDSHSHSASTITGLPTFGGSNTFTGSNDFGGGSLGLPHAASCAAVTGVGFICWDDDDDALFIGEGAGTIRITKDSDWDSIAELEAATGEDIVTAGEVLGRQVSTLTPGAGDACTVGDTWFESDAGIEWTCKDATPGSEVWWGVQLSVSP